MKNLVPYKIFESSREPHADAKEFMGELEKFSYKDILTSWITFTPRNTGRISFSGAFIPSQAYLEKSANGKEWYYVYASAGNYYGHQYGNLQQLFPKLMKDFVKKGSPSYLNNKDVESVLSDDKWFFDNVESDYKAFYKKIQQHINSESGIVLDFSGLELPVLDKLSDLGLIHVHEPGDYGDLFISVMGSPDRAKDKLFWLLFDKIMEDYEVHSELTKFGSFSFYPKGTGVSPRATNRRMKIDIGFKTEAEAAEAIQRTLVKYMLKNNIKIRTWPGKISDETIEIINNIYHSMIKGAIDNSGDSIYSALDDYFTKNPLDIYILNSLPELKSGVLKRTGIKDLGRAGSIINSKYI